MTINILTVGSSGVHSFRKLNVNSEDNYIYFKNGDIPESIIDGASYIYSNGTGSILGIDSGELVYAFKESKETLKFVDDQEIEFDITGSTQGSILLNNPVLVNNLLNINISTPSNQAVKYFTNGDPIVGLTSGETYFLKNVAAEFTGTQALYDLTESQTNTPNVFTFTTCGQTGRLGPTNQDILGNYTTPWHNSTAVPYLKEGSFRGYQDWTVPVSGIYDFEVSGASAYEGSGSGTAGRGAKIKGRVSLTKGEIITVAVGQRGGVPSSGAIGGSGGGSFVVRKSGNEPLFVAGGGSADANTTSGFDAQTTTRGGFGTGGISRPGGVDGFGGPANNPAAGTNRLDQEGRSGGGGGFLGRGQNAFFQTQFGTNRPQFTQPGGGSFIDGLTAEPNSQYDRSGGDGGFGGGASGNLENAQSGGAGGYSGGAGTRAVNTNWVGGGGGSFITRSANNVGTSNGQYEDLSTFNNNPITNLNSYNTGEGSVVVTLVESFTSGNSVHPTAEDAENGTNAIAIQPAGNSYHAFVPISYDIQSDRIHFTSPHGFEDSEAISFSLSSNSPDLSPINVYYVDKIDDFTIGLVFSPAVNFTVPTPKSQTDTIRKIVVNLDLDSINIPNHGFSVDQPVRYSAGGGTPIQAAVPLSEGATYYIAQVVDANNIKLKTAIDSPTVIDFTAAGTGTNHSFIFLTVNTAENTLYIPSHGLVSGQAV